MNSDTIAMIVLVGIVTLGVIAIVSVLWLARRMQLVATLVWLVAIIGLPIVGAVVWLVLGHRVSPRPRDSRG